MKRLNYDIIHFIGIGGIGMSALARWFNAGGYRVIGYDKTATELTSNLISEGIIIHFEDDVKHIASDATNINTLVIYTPAVPALHKQLIYFKANGFAIKKRAEVLGEISRSYFTVAVAGTHGKTTTSSMIAHLLHSAGVDVIAFIGGIASNFNSNFVSGKSDKAIAIMEADEFDRSFLHLSPNVAVVTSTDADHLDIYGNANELVGSFEEFVSNLQDDSTLLISQKANDSLTDIEGEIYGLKGSSVWAANLEIVNDVFVFDFNNQEQMIRGLELHLPGFYNVENTLAAIQVALLLGVSPTQVTHGIATYKGVKRRFETIFKSQKHIYIDDYAHHPEEIKAFITSARAIYPNKKLAVIFQPHLFSRTKDFALEFAKALDKADEVWVMDIYPARELPMDGVNAELILGKMELDKKHKVGVNELLNEINSTDFDVLATLGAGDIDRMVPKINSLLLNDYSRA